MGRRVDGSAVHAFNGHRHGRGIVYGAYHRVDGVTCAVDQTQRVEPSTLL